MILLAPRKNAQDGPNKKPDNKKAYLSLSISHKNRKSEIKPANIMLPKSSGGPPIQLSSGIVSFRLRLYENVIKLNTKTKYKRAKSEIRPGWSLGSLLR